MLLIETIVLFVQCRLFPKKLEELVLVLFFSNFQTDTCDFESNTICGYTQDQSDDFDWIRDFGGTSSLGTGPAVDHTYGTKSGE